MNRLQTELSKGESWRDNLKSSSLKVGFQLCLTRTMCEFLSAVADGVRWDRSKWGSASAFPDNFLATSAALYKRGLIQRKPQAECDARENRMQDDDKLYEWTSWNLTPAGEHVVGLLKMAGVFVEADAAIEKKSRKK